VARSRPASTAATVALIGIVVVIVAIQMSLPSSVTLGPSWLVPVIELSGIPISIALTMWLGSDEPVVRVVMTAYLVFLVLACVMNAVLLLVSLLKGSQDSGEYLLFAGFGVLAINVLSFGLVYWWIDGGGPERRMAGTATAPDFLFPQQGMGLGQGEAQPTWQPGLIDYLFTAYTNIIAFSPTDTMPLTHRVKILFTVQSTTALLTIVVTLSRAVNLIPGGVTG
jgi:hypothetical protein